MLAIPKVKSVYFKNFTLKPDFSNFYDFSCYFLISCFFFFCNFNFFIYFFIKIKFLIYLICKPPNELDDCHFNENKTCTLKFYICSSFCSLKFLCFLFVCCCL
jgi:hypothetical protein